MDDFLKEKYDHTSLFIIIICLFVCLFFAVFCVGLLLLHPRKVGSLQV